MVIDFPKQPASVQPQKQKKPKITNKFNLPGPLPESICINTENNTDKVFWKMQKFLNFPKFGKIHKFWKIPNI